MKRQSIKKILRKQYTPRLVFPLLIFAASLIIMIVNPFKGTFKAIDISELADVEAVNGSTDYVHITVDELNYSGINYTTNNKVKARVFYSLSNDRCYYFIISAKSLPEDYTVIHDQTITARLIHNNTMYEDINASMSKSLNFSIHGMREISSDTLISQYDYAHGFTTFYFTAAAIVCIIALLAAVSIAIIIFLPTLSICAFRLGRYGNRKTLFALAETEFDISVATGRKNVYVTDNFLIIVHPASIDMVPLDKIAWVYHYSEVHHTRTRTRVNTPLCIVTDRRKMIKIHHVSDASADKIINALTMNHPEILVGYNEK